MIKYVLAYGNYMNGQSNRGGNYGFSLSDLVYTSKIKSHDNSFSLMQYVMKKIEIDNS